MICWLSPVSPETVTSGGTRKLGDLSAILAANGFDSTVVDDGGLQVMASSLGEGDLVVVPEIYGRGLDSRIPRGVPRVAFAQNGYLIDMFYCEGDRPHPYVDTPDLKAVMVESEHTAELVRLRVPDLKVPIIRTHSSGNGRMGKDAGFRYGPWPRRKVVMYFGYKHDRQNGPVFDDLPLPAGWSTEQLRGSDAQVAEAMRTGAIFAAPNAIEGLCAPTQEAMISGALIVGWPGGPSRYAHHPTPEWAWEIARDREFVGGPMEYLAGRALLVPQDDVGALRAAIVEQARMVDELPECWAAWTAAWSKWHRCTYSREREVAEIIEIMSDLTGGLS